MAVRVWRLQRRGFATSAVGCVGIALLYGPVAMAGLVAIGTIPYLVVEAIKDLSEATLVGGAGLLLVTLLIWMVMALVAVSSVVGLARTVLRYRTPGGQLVIGSEGLRFRSGFLPTYLRWDEIDSVVADAGARRVRVSKQGGEHFALLTNEADALASALNDARVAFEETAEEEPLQKLIGVNAPNREWIGKARALGAATAYRDGAIAEDRLVRIATSPKAERLQRLGSALALSGASEESQARVRAAAEDAADPELAQALAEALEGDISVRRLRAATKNKRY